MPRVEIFHAKMCWACDEAMGFFKERGIAFESYEVAWKGDDWEGSENARKMTEMCGEKMDFVPQIFIDGRHIKGWKELSALIESGEVEGLL